MSPRMSLAAQAGAFVGARVGLMSPPVDLDMSVFDGAEVFVRQDMMPDAELWQTRQAQSWDAEDVSCAVVFLPRAKAAARDAIARAARRADRVIIDGQKTDGVEAVLKDIRRRCATSEVISKAHGKLFWFDQGADFDDWLAQPAVIDGRWQVRPGVFSADSVDPGSAALAEALPDTLKGRVADLGAGWGYLSGCALERCAKITELHLVEAQGRALDCARQNVADPRARFHWDDATRWAVETGLDNVIMNPPFHTGRAAEPGLGRAFIAAAARLLRPGGTLWMVANRHLAYEQDLRERFAEVAEIAGDTRYKVIRATLAVGRHRK